MSETHSPANEETKWFALAVAPRKEKVTAKLLQLKGYEYFLPLYAVRRRWSDRIKTLEQPLFPGYIFCRFAPNARVPVLKIDPVISILGQGKDMEAVPDAEISALQTVCKSGVQVVPCPYLTAGAKVRIQEGPLQGLEGVLVEDKETRLVLSVALLQRSVSVQVERSAVTPLHVYRQF